MMQKLETLVLPFVLWAGYALAFVAVTDFLISRVVPSGGVPEVDQHRRDGVARGVADAQPVVAEVVLGQCLVAISRGDQHRVVVIEK